MSSTKYIILDRDGVINLDSPAYIKTPNEWIPITGSLKAIAKFNQLGYQVIVVTNQSGIARNYYSLETLENIHQKMLALVREVGGDILDIFFCPHGPDDNCICRKPETGMYDAIKAKYPNIDFKQTYSIGDSLRDLQASQRVGCLPILVKTGNGLKTLEKIKSDPALTQFKQTPIFDNLWSLSESLGQ